MKTLLHKLNWRLIVIHLVVLCLCAGASREFALLHDYEYFEKTTFSYLVKDQPPFDSYRFITDIIYIEYAGLIGLLVGFLIILALSVKKSWFWLNPFFAFIIALFSLKNFIAKANLGYLISLLFFDILHREFRIVATGSLMVAIIYFLLFSPQVNRFIKNGFYHASKSFDPVIMPEN
jgi:hypothetical protein